ncbi:stealth conserved region 3 domain-containing protein [Streptomyces sp. DW26H14]|uniref:stealth conserved region 3 domain-containing protein n=1 Tax=Streptomyces sp. DW26H14 TaxID=3435395 RepID=UPI00403E03D3
MQNPEAPRLVGAYRRILPEEARRLVAGRVGPDLRRRIKLGLASAESTRERIRKTRAARKYGSHMIGPKRRVVAVDEAIRLALAEEGMTPVRARRSNLRDVLSLLEAAGVEHFCVRGSSQTAAAVAVAASDRDTVLSELLKFCAVQPGYVAPVRRGQPADSDLYAVERSGAWRRIAGASVLRLVWYRTDPTGKLILGAAYGCDLEFWAEEAEGAEGAEEAEKAGKGGRLVSPRAGRVTDSVPVDGELVQADESYFTDLVPRFGPVAEPVRVPTRAEFVARTTHQPDFPIDVVYTWVDGSDPDWQRKRARHSGAAYHEEAANDARYLSRDELRYSLRSLHLYAPWVRTVYLVTDRQAPAWLNAEHPGIQLVDHRDVFQDPSWLPTFNSHAIESQLHHIDGLSEHFLYFNDDVLLGRETTPGDFFFASGISRFFPSPALVPLGPVGDDDPPVAAAGKNNRRLIERSFGAVLVQKMKHMPHALNRSVLTEIEVRYADEYRTTAGSRFRSMDDLSITSSLHHYYAFHTGRAVPSNELLYNYIDLSREGAERRLGQLIAHRERHVFCVNDTGSTVADAEKQSALLHGFLADYFPVPSPFERVQGEQ